MHISLELVATLRPISATARAANLAQRILPRELSKNPLRLERSFISIRPRPAARRFLRTLTEFSPQLRSLRAAQGQTTADSR